MIHTPRTTLRRFSMSDLPSFSELLADPEATKFTSFGKPQTPEQAETRLKSLIDKQKSQGALGSWAAIHSASSELVGYFMLLNGRLEHTELGFMLTKKYWGQGYASEIARVLASYAFDEADLSVLAAVTNQDNHASKSVLKKIGFKFVKVTAFTDQKNPETLNLDYFEVRR